MGIDFTALLHYPGPGRNLDEAVACLEGESPKEFDRFVEMALAVGFHAYFNSEQAKPSWKVCCDAPWAYGENLKKRPTIPTLHAALGTPELFHIRIGWDAVLVYHPIRWQVFLTNEKIQAAFLNAVASLCRLFGADECIVCGDNQEPPNAFCRGAPFEVALRAGEPECGEVTQLRELYIQLDEDGTWDTRGYWRFIREKINEC